VGKVKITPGGTDHLDPGGPELPECTTELSSSTQKENPPRSGISPAILQGGEGGIGRSRS
jgi:hypothetical protein